MCLVVLAINTHPEYKLIIAANRDEYYDRPAAPLSFWKDVPDLLAGRDLRAGGTWFGITTSGKLAAITNYRDPLSDKKEAPSRGKLLVDYLSGNEGPDDYLVKLAGTADCYNGFNLIFGVEKLIYWFSNRGNKFQQLTSGIYGLSNRLLDTPWPKVLRAKHALEDILSTQIKPDPEALFHMLCDRSVPHDKYLPDTGVGIEWERTLSSVFIKSPNYGTRSSTLLFIDLDNQATLFERTYNSEFNNAKTIKYTFMIKG
ncbi:MAG: hypothetical protein B1H11_06470 [Desulfobacteraceae bacterium 4484_190.1]|nr:MAG: hypothetical protein B1H11_06470 [Desulfobacteraceae bacterium 4484_190.1]